MTITIFLIGAFVYVTLWALTTRLSKEDRAHADSGDIYFGFFWPITLPVFFLAAAYAIVLEWWRFCAGEKR